MRRGGIGQGWVIPGQEAAGQLVLFPAPLLLGYVPDTYGSSREEVREHLGAMDLVSDIGPGGDRGKWQAGSDSQASSVASAPHTATPKQGEDQGHRWGPDRCGNVVAPGQNGGGLGRLLHRFAGAEHSYRSLQGKNESKPTLGVAREILSDDDRSKAAFSRKNPAAVALALWGGVATAQRQPSNIQRQLRSVAWRLQGRQGACGKAVWGADLCDTLPVREIRAGRLHSDRVLYDIVLVHAIPRARSTSSRKLGPELSFCPLRSTTRYSPLMTDSKCEI